MTSPFQEIVLTSSPDGPIIAYNASSGATLAHFSSSRSPRRGLALAGKSLIAASHISSTTASGSIRLYNWWSSTAHHHLRLPEPVAPLATTPDGSYLFAGGLSGNIHTLTLPSGNILKSVTAHSKPVSCLEVIDDGSLLISGSDDGTIVVSTVFKLLTASSNENSRDDFILHRIFAHTGSVTVITAGMRGSNSTIISCSSDCTCKFWTLLHGRLLRTVTFPCPIWGLALDPLESEFFAAGSDGSIYIGAMKVVSRKLVSQGRELVTWGQKHGGAIVSVAVVNEGQHLISASEDGSVWVWDVVRGEVINVLGNEMEGISDLVVAKGIGHGARLSSDANESGCRTFGFSGRELSSPVRGITEMGRVLSVVGKDRSRAIDMLESAIAMYERLLELILKEAKGGSSSNSKEN